MALLNAWVKSRESYMMVSRDSDLKSDMKQLYKIFLSKTTRILSYRTFCRYKPKIVVKPKLSGRHTCLCKLCENAKYVFKSCKSNGILNVGSIFDVTNSICCNDVTTECLLRNCKKCCDKKVIYVREVDQKPVMYYEWVVCKERKYNSKTKKEIIITVTKKTAKYCTVGARDKKCYFIWALRFLQSVFDLSLKCLPPIAQLALIFLPRGFRLSSLCQKEETCLPTYFSAWLQFGFSLTSIWLP